MALHDKSVLVLGAGINGVAIARELVLNDVLVCLVDCGDIAGGTTAYSTRLIHGGLRYLEYGEFSLVRESLEERERLLKLAPQFVRPLRLFIPVSRKATGIFDAARKFFNWPTAGRTKYVPRGLILVRLGLFLYDRFARSSALPRHTVHRTGEPATPRVDAERFPWLASYYDAQVAFPERFVVAMLQDAQRRARHRSVPLDIYTYHRAVKSGATVSLQRVPCGGQPMTENSPVHGVTLPRQPAVIVNATGAWVDRTLAQLQVPAPPLIGGTKGSHFLTRHAALSAALADGGVYAEARDGRPVFVLPLGPYALVGTTDLPYDGDPRSVTAGEDELQYLLDAVQEVFPQVTLSRADIDMHYCGVRPLPNTSAAQTAAITRRHLLHVSDHPDATIVSVIGGKLTTCRSLAEETARLVLTKLGRPVTRNSRDCVIPGGEYYPAAAQELAAEHARLAEQYQLTPAQVAAVWSLCGTRLSQMLVPEPGHREEDNSDLTNVIDTDLPLRFVRRVIRDEWCCRLEDLVERRLMLLYQPDLSRNCLQHLAQLMQEAGLLPAAQLDQEVARCADRLRTHFGRTLT